MPKTKKRTSSPPTIDAAVHANETEETLLRMLSQSGALLLRPTLMGVDSNLLEKPLALSDDKTRFSWNISGASSPFPTELLPRRFSHSSMKEAPNMISSNDSNVVSVSFSSALLKRCAKHVAIYPEIYGEDATIVDDDGESGPDAALSQVVGEALERFLDSMDEVAALETCDERQELEELFGGER